MVEPLPPAKLNAPEPDTAHALWPTFMRRTLTVEEVEDAAPEPRRGRDDAAVALLRT